jgi:hypothetical protein
MDYIEFENALQLIDSVKVLSEAIADSPNLADLNCASIFRMIFFVLENAEQPLREVLEEMISSDSCDSGSEFTSDTPQAGTDSCPAD